MNINRYEKNPIIKIEDVVPSSPDMKVIGVFNCGVTEYLGKTLLLLRVAENALEKDGSIGVPIYNATQQKVVIMYFDKNDTFIDFSDPRFVKTSDKLYLTSISHFKIAISENGVDFTIEDLPFMVADNEYEEYGIEDPRIVFLEGRYYITYSAVSEVGVVTCLASTLDFKKVKRHGIIFLADNKDVTIFPQKINGQYYAIHRPVSAYFNRPEMWISVSDDLKGFYNHKRLCSLRSEKFDSMRMGASCVPFLTDYGWLEIYHGCDKNGRYTLGAMLLDKDNPSKILARSNMPIMEPDAFYEKVGFVPNVIFTCGCLTKGDTVHLYYGACDESICYATLWVKDIIALLL